MWLEARPHSRIRTCSVRLTVAPVAGFTETCREPRIVLTPAFFRRRRWAAVILTPSVVLPLIVVVLRPSVRSRRCNFWRGALVTRNRIVTWHFQAQTIVARAGRFWLAAERILGFAGAGMGGAVAPGRTTTVASAVPNPPR